MYNVGPGHVNTLSHSFKYGAEIVFNTRGKLMCNDRKTNQIKGVRNIKGSLCNCFSYKTSLVFLEGMKPYKKRLILFSKQRWWSSETIALVTGANRGIGFEIARQLLLQGMTVILTSRGTEVGEAASKVLLETGFNLVFRQLNVTDPLSIKTCADWVQQDYGGLDILVNNAGVNYNASSENSVESAEQVIATNYFGTKNMIKALTPLMRPSAAGARIVNVSSRLGRLKGRRNRIGDVRLRESLECVDSLTEEVIDRTVNAFLEQVKDGSWATGGWPQTFTDYSISKLAVNAYTRLMAKKFSDRPEGEKIYINCCCPGWVKTAMTGWEGNISPEEGADTAVWLALLPDEFVTGKFFAERREINF